MLAAHVEQVQCKCLASINWTNGISTGRHYLQSKGRQENPWFNRLFSDNKVDNDLIDRASKSEVVVINLSARALTVFSIFVAQTVYAQVTVDVSKITCEQFSVLPRADDVAIWLSGYYHGGRHNAIIDMNKFDESARNLRAACRLPDNFKRPIMELIESNILK